MIGPEPLVRTRKEVKVRGVRAEEQDLTQKPSRIPQRDLFQSKEVPLTQKPLEIPRESVKSSLTLPKAREKDAKTAQQKDNPYLAHLKATQHLNSFKKRFKVS